MKIIDVCITVLLFSNLTIAQWSWQNPLPQGNNINNVKFISSMMGWAVGENGTILRTTNGGTSWVLQQSGTSASLHGVSFSDANNGTAVGFGLENGEYKGVILRTTNGGVTWTSQIRWVPYHLEGVSFSDSNNGIVVGEHGTILRTTDGGINWNLQQSGTTGYLYGISFTDANNGTAVGENGTILRTTNGGTSWAFQQRGTIQTFSGVSFTDSNNGTAVGTNGTILRTTNGGTSWAFQQSGTSDNLLGVSFTDANSGTALGDDFILRTTDGGTTWIMINLYNIIAVDPLLNVHYLKGISFSDSNNGTLVGKYGIILRTTNNGITWTTQSSGNFNSLRSVAFADANNGMAVGGSTILKTINKGATWTVNKTESDLNSVSFIDSNTATAVGGGGTILRTTNGGMDWVIQWSGTGNTLNGVSFTDAINGTAVGTNGTILRTTNGGTSWALQQSGTSASLNGVSFKDTNNGIVVGAFGTILKTTNGGASWIKQQSGITIYELFSVSFIDSATANVVGVGGIILRTTNGGTSWALLQSGTSVSLYSVSFSDANNGTAVGGDMYTGSIIRTTDGGNIWIKEKMVIPQPLRSVCVTDANNGTAVGGSGTILSTRIEGVIFNILKPNNEEIWAVGSNQNITWQSNSASITNVKIEYSTDNGMTWQTIINSIAAETGSYNWTVPNTPSTNCRVRISDANNSTMNDVSDKVFAIKLETPAVPILISPISNSLNQSTTLTLNWNSVIGAATYRLQVSLDQSFVQPLVDDSVLTSPTKDIPALKSGMKYYWKVRAKNIAGISSYSPVWDFTTAIPSPESLTAEVFGLNKIKLTWIDKSETESGFIIERLAVSEANYKIVDTVKANQTTYVDSTVSQATTYKYRLKAFTRFATSDYTPDASVTTLTSVKSGLSGIPTEYTLLQNYPNPFNPSTVIRYALPTESKVIIYIYNALGQVVCELVNKVQPAGYFETVFNIGHLPSGIYIYSMEVQSSDGKNNFSSIKKMMLVK